MFCDRKRIYFFTIILCSILFLSFFIPISLRRVIVAIMLCGGAFLAIYLIKKRSILSINKKQVLYIMIIIGLVYLMCYYLFGLKFGFYRNLEATIVNKIFKYIIPITLMIISFEMIRRIILAQKLKVANLLLYISGVLVDLIIFVNYSGIFKFEHFMDIFGLSLLPAITFNLLYTYLSKNYGMWPNVAFRLIITLYLYIIPVVPQAPDVIISFLKLIIPAVIYLFIKVLYTKQKKAISHKKQGLSFVTTILFVAILTGFVMLVSCKFRYGILVIATESMTGEISKGDAVVYEEYRGQNIVEGQVIVFSDGDRKVVHRVVEIEKINNEIRYYTKGDANDNIDLGYRTSKDIVGITHFKIIYIGYPSLWMRSLFD